MKTTNFIRDIRANELAAINSIDNLVSEKPVDSSIAFYIILPFENDYYSRVVLKAGDTKISVKSISNEGIDSSKSKEFTVNVESEKKISKLIETFQPSIQKSIEDAIVDDGYTVIVKTSFRDVNNIFATRAFTKKGKKTPQFKFIAEYLKILNDNGAKINIKE